MLLRQAHNIYLFIVIIVWCVIDLQILQMKVNNIPLRTIELFVPIQSDPFSYKTEQQFSWWVVFPSCASWWHNDKMTWWHNDMTTWWLPFTSLLCLASSCLLLPRWNKLITILWNLNSILKFLQQEEDIYPYTFQIRRNPNLSSLFFNLTQAMRTLASRKREIWPFEEEIWQQHIFILWSGHWKKRQRFTTINRMKLSEEDVSNRHCNG